MRRRPLVFNLNTKWSAVRQLDCPQQASLKFCMCRMAADWKHGDCCYMSILTYKQDLTIPSKVYCAVRQHLHHNIYGQHVKLWLNKKNNTALIFSLKGATAEENEKPLACLFSTVSSLDTLLPLSCLRRTASLHRHSGVSANSMAYSFPLPLPPVFYLLQAETRTQKINKLKK